jgi:hypothetical protein
VLPFHTEGHFRATDREGNMGNPSSLAAGFNANRPQHRAAACFTLRALKTLVHFVSSRPGEGGQQ